MKIFQIPLIAANFSFPHALYILVWMTCQTEYRQWESQSKLYSLLPLMLVTQRFHSKSLSLSHAQPWIIPPNTTDQSVNALRSCIVVLPVEEVFCLYAAVVMANSTFVSIKILCRILSANSTLHTSTVCLEFSKFTFITTFYDNNDSPWWLIHSLRLIVRPFIIMSLSEYSTSSTTCDVTVIIFIVTSLPFRLLSFTVTIIFMFRINNFLIFILTSFVITPQFIFRIVFFTKKKISKVTIGKAFWRHYVIFRVVIVKFILEIRVNSNDSSHTHKKNFYVSSISFEGNKP